jgi:hypothetical protein
MGRRLFHIFVFFILLGALVAGVVAFSVVEPTIGRGRFLKQSQLITAASTSSPTRLTTPTLPVEPTVQQSDPPAVARLALRFQPTLVVSARDRFWPVSVLDTLNFRWKRRRTCLFRGDRCRLMPPKPTDLTQQGSSPSDFLQFPARVDRVNDQFVSSARALGVPMAAINGWRRNPTGVNPFPSAQMYFYYLRRAPDHAYRGVPNGLASLEYWFYFPLNYLPTVKTPLETLIDPISATIGNSDLHQGDFEHVAVLLDRRTKRPRYLWMARHGDEGLAFHWHSPRVQWTGSHNRHPVVYAAFGSHAIYRECGIQRRTRTFYVVNDYVVCLRHQNWGFTHQSTPLVDLAHTVWGCWQGHLGQAGRHLNRGVVNFVPYESDGPLSPLYQQENFGVAC